MAQEQNIKNTHIKGKLSEDLIDFLKQLRKDTEKDNDARVGWKRKLITASNQRMGLKRVTNRPYPGAPNVPLPEADKLISKTNIIKKNSKGFHCWSIKHPITKANESNFINVYSLLIFSIPLLF